MSEFPVETLHKIYAGVLGKLIGVYLGRPFENWTYSEIRERFGSIHYYVHEQLGLPLVVIDDDVSGTFAFIRALEEHGFNPDISSEMIGMTWLNNVIERRTVFWWGGNGISTEHTAYINLKKGVKPPMSGSRERNGKTLSEQIGAQIFIDGWAMVAPGNPALATKLAEAAARVSHDGVAVDAAVLWAVMEAEAFNSANVDHLLETGLSYIPEDSRLREIIGDVRKWAKEDCDWRKTREKIEQHYGYQLYGGICHMIPNHAIMILALLYGGHSFSHALHIINTCGWDTDCNSGNIGCLLAIMHGLDGLNEGQYDWRGPLADRAIISSADSGYGLNDAVRITYDLANCAAKLAGLNPLQPPKNGAQYHFSLPGSLQGFQSSDEKIVRLSHGESTGVGSLELRVMKNIESHDEVEITVQTFTARDILEVSRSYEMMASPLIYPGQVIKVQLRASDSNSNQITAAIRIKAYDRDDSIVNVDNDPVTLAPNEATDVEWRIPSILKNKPIQKVGLILTSALSGNELWLQSLSWSGEPDTTFDNSGTSSVIGYGKEGPTFWQRAWVSSISDVQHYLGPTFYLSHDYGEGLHYQGTREWKDVCVKVESFQVHLGLQAGVVFRVQGLNRWYGLLLRTKPDGGRYIALVKAKDEKRIELAQANLEWNLDQKYSVEICLDGGEISASVDKLNLNCTDNEHLGGAAGFLVDSGSVSAESLTVGPNSGKK